MPDTPPTAGDRGSPLPYDRPQDLMEAFEQGAEFVLHYHSRQYPVIRMELRDRFVLVYPPAFPVRISPDGRCAENLKPNPEVWLRRAHGGP